MGNNDGKACRALRQKPCLFNIGDRVYTNKFYERFEEDFDDNEHLSGIVVGKEDYYGGVACVIKVDDPSKNGGHETITIGHDWLGYEPKGKLPSTREQLYKEYKEWKTKIESDGGKIKVGFKKIFFEIADNSAFDGYLIRPNGIQSLHDIYANEKPEEIIVDDSEIDEWCIKSRLLKARRRQEIIKEKRHRSLLEKFKIEILNQKNRIYVNSPERIPTREEIEHEFNTWKAEFEGKGGVIQDGFKESFIKTAVSNAIDGHRIKSSWIQNMYDIHTGLRTADDVVAEIIADVKERKARGEIN